MILTTNEINLKGCFCMLADVIQVINYCYKVTVPLLGPQDHIKPSKYSDISNISIRHPSKHQCYLYAQAPHSRAEKENT